MTQGQRKINVLVVVAGLGVGGAEVVIQYLARTIDRQRFNLTICCLKVLGPIGEKLAAEGLDIVVLAGPGRQRQGILRFIKLRRLIRALQIDIIHTHTADALFDAALCRLLPGRAQLVHTFHFGNYPHRSGTRKLFERIGARLADCLVAVGDVQRSQIVSTFGLDQRDILRVWNGVEQVADRDGGAFRRQIGVTDQILVGVTATMIEQKGLSDFLLVADRIKAIAADVRFVIVGDGHLRPRLESLRRELALEETVIFAGWVPQANEIALPAFDIFLQPSLWEAMSIALLEAMAAGKAVVATRVGEAPRIVNDGIDGLLVDPRDVDAMTAALRRLIQDRDYRLALGGAAARKVASEFTVEGMTRSYEAIYAGLSQGSPSRR